MHHQPYPAWVGTSEHALDGYAGQTGPGWVRHALYGYALPDGPWMGTLGTVSHALRGYAPSDMPWMGTQVRQALDGFDMPCMGTHCQTGPGWVR